MIFLSFKGHLVLPISLLYQRSPLHLSQTIITAASTVGSKRQWAWPEGDGAGSWSWWEWNGVYVHARLISDQFGVYAHARLISDQFGVYAHARLLWASPAGRWEML